MPALTSPEPGTGGTQWLEDRLEIQDLYARYGRAVFLLDADELRKIFQPDAEVDKGNGPVQIVTYVPDVIARHSPITGASLQVTNTLVEFLAPDRAFVESWGLEVQRRTDEHGAPADYVYWVRYGDVVERRGSLAWRIASRRLVLDHVMEIAVRGTGPTVAENRFVGLRSNDDPIVQFRAELLAADA